MKYKIIKEELSNKTIYYVKIKPYWFSPYFWLCEFQYYYLKYEDIISKKFFTESNARLAAEEYIRSQYKKRSVTISGEFVYTGKDKQDV